MAGDVILNDGHTGRHKYIAGDAPMKKKSFNIIPLRPEDIPDEIVIKLAREKIKSELAKNGVVAHNLDEVLHKYISEEMRNEQKRRR